MSGTEILYSHSSFLITAGLFLAIMLFNEFGFRIGRYVQNRTDADVKSMTGSIQFGATLRGAISADGSYGVLAGGTSAGDSPQLLFFVRK